MNRIIRKAIALNRAILCYIFILMIAPGVFDKLETQLYAQDAVGQKSQKQKADITNSVLRDFSGAKTFYLTFDGHDDNSHISFILDTLKKNNVTATFFLTGKFIVNFPEDTKRIIFNGHTVGNHTLTHSYYKNSQQLLDELAETERLFYECTGKQMTKIWRAPYLQHIQNPSFLSETGKKEITHIDVSLYIDDWVDQEDVRFISNQLFMDIFEKGLDFSRKNRIHLNKNNYTKYNRSNAFNYSGVIMLMHAGSYRKKNDDFVLTLDSVIKILTKNGYQFGVCSSFIPDIAKEQKPEILTKP